MQTAAKWYSEVILPPSYDVVKNGAMQWSVQKSQLNIDKQAWNQMRSVDTADLFFTATISEVPPPVKTHYYTVASEMTPTLKNLMFTSELIGIKLNVCKTYFR